MAFPCTPMKIPTPRTDGVSEALSNMGVDIPFAMLALARELERELRQEQDAAMMAGSQISALRLQLKDAEERASRLAKQACDATNYGGRKI